MAEEHHPALFEPFALKGLVLRNRFVMPPMTRGFSPDGVPGADVAAYYARRAAADVALCITEGVGVDHPAALGSGSMEERNVPVLHGAAVSGWQGVTDAVHKAGGLIMPQLWHMGPIRRNGTGPHPGAATLRPSGIWGPLDGSVSMPQIYRDDVAPETAPMTDEDIADVIAAYGRSAANAKAAGFDGVAVHGAHGYLIDSFFWDGTNKRTDRWGGSIAARTAFGVEVIRAIRAAIGPNLPISFRFSQWKIQDYGGSLAATPDDLAALLLPLAEAGVDMFEASTRIFDAPAFAGSDLTLAGWAKAITGCAVAAVGGVGLSKDLQSSFGGGTVTVNNLDRVERLIASGEFDLIQVGRSLIMDPEFVRKVKTGQDFAPFRLEAYGALA